MRPLFDTVGQIASRQHGRITWRQLLAAGVHDQQIKRWFADGRLRRVHRGIYAVGHVAPSLLSDYMGAVLACGEGALLSHQAAGHAYRALRERPARPHVTVPTTAGRSRPDIVIHRVHDLHPLDATTWHGIPITTLPRCLLDMAPRLTPSMLTRACHEAWIRHDVTPAHIDACIARNPTKKGITKLRRALGSDVTLSDLEDDFLALLDRHNLPQPRTNIGHAGDKVDCHWPDHNLTIELVTFRYHATRQGFERDVARRRRSNHIQYTYGDVIERGAQTAAEVARLLTQPSHTRPAAG